MTLMKSILLGSAAGIVAVAGAQAADLPTRKAAPAEYVRICNVGGMAGFIIPGSDTCLKIGGYITGQVEAGNTTTGYHWAPVLGAPVGSHDGHSLLTTPASLRPNLGFTTRLNVSLDARQNTAYGVLRGYAEMQFENGNGFDTTGAGAYINLAYVQWAGITAGKAPSFFSFFGGGEGWANIFSPDQQGFNQPDVLAYTATFGGGFSATIAVQSPGPNSQNFGAGAFSAFGNVGGNNGASGGGTNLDVNTSRFGMTAPDIVGNIRVDQTWGSAQLSGVAHQVHVFVNGFTPAPGVTHPGLNTWGFAVDGGVKFNLPTLGAGDNIQLQGVYTKNAIWYSGIPDGMWGENGAVNGNGLAMTVGDTYAFLNPAGITSFATPTTWTIGGTFEHHFSPVFSIDPQASYVQLNWSGSNGQLSSNSQSWIVGAVAHWDPVPLLDFAFELMYQNTHQSTPGNWGTTGTVNGIPTAFKANEDGFAGRFYITRNF
jgi:hypothetical protein